MYCWFHLWSQWGIFMFVFINYIKIFWLKQMVHLFSDFLVNFKISEFDSWKVYIKISWWLLIYFKIWLLRLWWILFFVCLWLININVTNVVVDLIKTFHLWSRHQFLHYLVYSHSLIHRNMHLITKWNF